MSDEQITEGSAVRCRTAFGEWVPARALSEPRYDVANAIRRDAVFLSVSVDMEGWDHPVNWPAEDVECA